MGETKTQWKAVRVGLDGEDGWDEIRILKHSGKEIGTDAVYWRSCFDRALWEQSIEEARVAAEVRAEKVRAAERKQQERLENAVVVIKPALEARELVDEDLGIYKMEIVTRDGRGVLFFTTHAPSWSAQYALELEGFLMVRDQHTGRLLKSTLHGFYADTLPELVAEVYLTHN